MVQMTAGRSIAGIVVLLCVGAFAQGGHSSQENSKKDTSDPPPEEILTRSYAVGREFVPEERGWLLVRLIQVASRVQPTFAKAWIRELDQLIKTLPLNSDRAWRMRAALNFFAPLDAEASMGLLEGMDAPLPSRDGTVGQDIRASAAEAVYPQYWKQRGLAGLARMRQASRRIAESGQYPYNATATVIREVAKQDPAAARALFTEAVASYAGGTRVRASDREYVNFLHDLQGVVPVELMHAALEVAVKHLSEYPSDESGTYRSRIYTDNGVAYFQSRSDEFLFVLLGPIREIDPDWARKILEERPSLQKLSGFIGRVQYGERTTIVGDGGGGRTGELEQRGLEESRLARVRIVARDDPEEALRLSRSFQDPTRAAIALAYAAGAFYSKDPERGRALLRDARAKIPEVKDPLQKVRLRAVFCKTAADAGDVASFREDLQPGLELGEELFQQDLDAHPTSHALDTDVIGYLGDLVSAGIRVDRSATLSYIDQLQSNVLRAYLLVSAADALYTVPRAANR